jgi:phenylalanyl-tRNA synthetase beta chain
VSGVRVGSSPDRIQMRLIAAGVRPISNVVDASNYVMVELGKPIHTFDAAAIDGGAISVRLARAGERLTTLDHVDRELDPETLLIADRNGPLAIAGVMGGASSEVSDSTAEVVVESAIFDPVSIRRTAFRYALRSEASLRFEKGQEIRLARIGADRTAQLIAEWAGGIVDRGRVDSAPLEPGPERVFFRPAKVSRLLGMDLSAAIQGTLLGRAGIVVETPAPDAPAIEVPIAGGTMPLAVTAPATDVLVAHVPTWRRDLAIEADLIEEIVRLEGYDRVPTTLPATPIPAFRASPLILRDAVRAWLAGEGLREVVTHALVSPRHLETFEWRTAETPADGEAWADGSSITVTNPLSADHAVLRQGLVGGLLDVVALNRRRGTEDMAVFEVGKGYGSVDGEPHEWWRLGIALAGAFDVPAWNRPRRVADVDDLKGVVTALCRFLGLPNVTLEPLTDEPALHPGRSARLAARDGSGALGLSGRLGEVHPAVAAGWDARTDGTVVAELSVRGLSGGTLPVPRGLTPPRHPDVERDLAVVVSEGHPAGAVEAAISASAGPLLRSVRLFDVYRGAPLAVDEHSLAFRLVFGAPDRTLAEAEVDVAMAAVIGALESVGGRIRS